MHRLSGQCHCQAIQLELQLPQPPASYQPRACDCDFCRKHAAAYVSDPDGALRIRARPGALGLYRQGSAKAQCVYCTHCGVLIGVMYEAVGHRYATVNVRVLDGEVAVSISDNVVGRLARFRDRGEPCLAELIAVVFLQKQPFFDKFQQHPADAGPGYA